MLTLPYPGQAHGSIGRDQRFTRDNPCPICGGSDDDKRGRGERCAGYLSEDGRYAFCTREERAGNLPSRNTSPISYKHLLEGACRCGETHGGAIERPAHDPTTPRQINTVRSHRTRQPDRTHTYYDANHQPYMRVLRIGSGSEKRFIAQRPDGAGDWYDGLEGLTPILYRLPDLLAADPWAPVFVVEGEKCADDLINRGQLATCNPFGAGKWGRVPGASEALRGRHVVILADNDGPGRAHADQVAAALAGVAASVRIVLLPGLADKGDVYDWLADGHTAKELRRLAADTPIITACQPSAQESTPATQDDPTPQSQKTASGGGGVCPRCAPAFTRQGEALRIAETSLTNIRRERAIENSYLSMPKETLGAPQKLAAIALRREIYDSSAQDINEQGLRRITRAALAARIGVKENAAGDALAAIEKAGLITKATIKSFDQSAMYVGPGPLYDTPADVEPPLAPTNTWGGPRVRQCKHCHSDNLETRYICHGCGSLLTQDETKVVVRATATGEGGAHDGDTSPAQEPCPGPQDDPTPAEGETTTAPTQDTPSRPYLIVGVLASLAPDALADTTAPASPTPADALADADPAGEYISADAIPSAPDAKHNRALTALWAYQRTHGGEAPDERAWREQGGYGHAAQAVMAFSHVTAALMKAGLVRQDARYRYTLATPPTPTGGA